MGKWLCKEVNIDMNIKCLSIVYSRLVFAFVIANLLLSLTLFSPPFFRGKWGGDKESGCILWL